MKINKLIDKDEITPRIREIAKEIRKDFKDKVTCIVVLEGAMVFFGHLKKELERLGLDVTERHVRISSYIGFKRTRIKGDVDLAINDSAIIVEDIIDSGNTIEFLKRKIGSDIMVCSLLNKSEMKIDYQGFKVPDEFIVGFGLDYDGKYRELDYIGYITPPQTRS
jgi:hypoxanthine phosphoribosyltransferase